MKQHISVYNRGGASEASVAILTDYVAGARDISVRQARRLIALRACAMVAESAMSETLFFSRKENLAKKI